MSILPVTSAAPLVGLGVAAGAVVAGAASGFAQKLGSALSGGSKTEAAASPVAKSDDATSKSDRIAEFKRRLGALLPSFHGQLQAALAGSGIGTEQPFEISEDVFGDLRVSESHPSRREIEQTLEQNPGLQSLFREVLALAGQVANAEEGSSATSAPQKVLVLPQSASLAS